jgi:RNA polymerase sigma-54 factor
MLQIQNQSLRPLTTAHLAQTMTLLTLPNPELRDRIMAEIAANPALELVDEPICPNCRRKLTSHGPCPACARSIDSEGPIVFLSTRDGPRPSRSAGLEETPMDREPAAPETLAEYVLQQLAADLHPEDRPLAAYILASLDEDGFLQDHPAIIARATRSSLTQVTSVLALITRADPPGLATAGPREALLSQIALLGQNGPHADLARQMLTETFAELGRREFEAIGQRLGVRAESARQAADFIRDNLNPYPARAFWGSGRQPQGGDPNVYHNPDIQITFNPNGGQGSLLVEVFAPVSGWLRINPLFRQAMSQTSEERSSEWAQDLDRATLFVKCLQQRNNTMRRLMEILVARQSEFIVKGDRFLKPMTRAGVAGELSVHESTISRAVSHKSIAFPDGRIIPLARFFDRSLSVRDRVKEIVDNETRPLTDDEIAAALSDEGITVARRTVAKYRAMEGILPARLRHRKQVSRSLRATAYPAT